MENVRLIDNLDDIQKSAANLVLLFAEDLEITKTGVDAQIFKIAERKFYNNTKSFVGYKYKKPISKYV